MSEWVVVPCLLTLRNEWNKVNPKRDKGADGTIGDSNHTSSSDHTPDEDSSVLRNKDSDNKNEVHALDIDSSGPWPDGKSGPVKGSWFDKKIHQLIAEEKRRWLDPNDMCRLHYIIWNHKIYSSTVDFAERDYDGDDPHTNHAHFSARYETRAENDTRPWGVYVSPEPEEDPLAAYTLQEIADAILDSPIGNETYKKRTVRQALNDLSNHRDAEDDPKVGRDGIKPGTVFADLVAAADKINGTTAS